MEQVARQLRPLGRAGQTPLLKLRRGTRMRTLALHHWAGTRGVSLREVAARVGVAHQTISDWSHRLDMRSLDSAARGRPCREVATDVKDHILELLEECRGRIGLPSLKSAFYGVPRSTLRDLRQAYRCLHDGSTEHLTWTTPGSVWAADFTQADVTIDGHYGHVLSVRDLASYYHLLSLPVSRADGNAAIAALIYLFTAHGAPLVLKTDNGSHFFDSRIITMFTATRVTHLASPPMTPRYNGSQEAGIGSLKTRTLHIAAAHGRPGGWTCDDVEAARLEANHQARPWGSTGPVPLDVWENRSPIANSERVHFLAALETAREHEWRKMQMKKKEKPGSRPASAAAGAAADSLNASERATVVRRAIRRVLLELGYLCVRRTAN